MIVSTEHKKLVLRLNNPGKVVGVVPGAQEFVFRGMPLVAVPHKVSQTRILRNLGIVAPSPIAHHYGWPNGGRKSPMKHQIATAAFLTLNPRAYCLNEMGTCKTLTVLWAYHYLKNAGEIDAMIVVCPLSAMERAWGDEIYSNFFDTTFSVVHGDTERRLKRINEQRDVYIVNHDGIKNEQVSLALTQKVIRHYGKDRVLIVLDESGEYRNAKSDRWAALDSLIQPCAWIWALTGTPAPKSPTDVWAQCRLVTPWTVPRYYGRFRESVMLKVNTYKWVPKRDWKETMYRVMQPGIRYVRSECFDMPPIVTSYAHAEMGPEARKAYAQMMDGNRATFEGGQVVAMNEAVMRQKLVQIACGVIYDGETEYEVPVGPRVQVLLEKIAQSTAKVIVFVPLSGALTRIAQRIKEEGYSVAVVEGSTSKGARDQIFADFQNREEPHVIVAQPGCMAHALTLTEANTIIWYCPPNANNIYEQANARIPRPGQRNDMFIIHIESCEVERQMYKRLEQQGSMQGLVLELYEKGRTAA